MDKIRQGCKLIDLGDGVRVIICGCPETADHVCDEKAEMYEFSDGFRGTLLEKVLHEKMNPNMCDDDKVYFLNQRDIFVRAWSVACSICGRAEIDNAWKK